MSQGSPVPEWFGQGGPEQAAGAAQGGKGGCAGFVLGLLLAGGVAGFAFSKAADNNRRAQTLQARAESCEEQRREDERRHEERIDKIHRQAAPAATPAEPVPPVLPDVDTEQEPALADAEATGERSRAEIQKTLSALKPRLRACYQNALTYAPDAKGRISVRLTIAPSGTVSSARANSVGALPAGVTQCVIAVMKTARFSPSESTTTVSYPVVFEAKQ